MRGTVLVLLICVGCGGSGDGTGDDVLDPPPPEGGQQLATPELTLAPGEEKYMCYAFLSPERDVAIVGAEAINAPGVHHLGLYKAMVNEVEEVWDCSDKLISLRWEPIWGVGVSEETLTMPAGTGFQIPGYSQYVVQLHLQNAGDEPLAVRAGVNLTYAPDDQTASLVPAGIFALGTFEIAIPAGATDHTQSIPCAVDRDMNVFAVLPHMHKLGTKIELSHADDATTPLSEIYGLDPWDFNKQPIVPQDFRWDPGHQLAVTCHWDNPGAAVVEFGEGSDDEMCFFVVFYYPYTGLDGCVAGMM
jgi:hypothetical protein